MVSPSHVLRSHFPPTFHQASTFHCFLRIKIYKRLSWINLCLVPRSAVVSLGDERRNARGLVCNLSKRFIEICNLSLKIASHTFENFPKIHLIRFWLGHASTGKDYYFFVCISGRSTRCKSISNFCCSAKMRKI